VMVAASFSKFGFACDHHIVSGHRMENE